LLVVVLDAGREPVADDVGDALGVLDDLVQSRGVGPGR